MTLAKAIRHEAFTQTQQANSLQFSLEVGFLPCVSWKSAYKLELKISSGRIVQFQIDS